MKAISKYVLDQFDYEDGSLWWKKHQRRVGSPHSRGYLTVKVDHVNYYVHRIIWVMHHGDTQLQIDHINRCKADNRIENLRAVTPAVNMTNTPVVRSGGVCWDKANSRWRVTWRSKNIASTRDKLEAWCIRKSMEISYGNS